MERNWWSRGYGWKSNSKYSMCIFFIFNHIKLPFYFMSLSSFIHNHASSSQSRNLGDILNSSLFLILPFSISENPMKSTAYYFLNVFTSSNPLDNVEFYLNPVLM